MLKLLLIACLAVFALVSQPVLADERGELGRGFITSTADVDSFIYTVNRPRTIGLHLWKNI